MNTKWTVAALALTAGAASADLADLRITEAFAGLSGPDGTADWIELTNTGGSTISLGGLFYDDASADITAGGDLPAFDLLPGASVVILVDVDIADGDGPAAIAEFESIWGAGIDVFATEGGGLSNDSGDTIFILDGSGDVVTVVDTPASLVGALATIDYVSGPATGSVLGVNGAYESAQFVNEDLGLAPDFLVSLVGSPGRVPAPGAAALLGLAGLTVARRRR